MNLADILNTINKEGINRNTLDKFLSVGEEILASAAKKARIKDSFTATLSYTSHTLDLKYKSTKTNSFYHLMYDSYTRELIFETYIESWENIKNIKDTFWVEFLSSSDTLDFDFFNCYPLTYDKKATPEFAANFKSINFRIMMYYINAMLVASKERDNIMFGGLEKIWTGKTTIPTIISELNECFRVFYRLNYLLFKAEKVRKINKQTRKLKSNKKTNDV
ncbi:hypothetical protein SAMN04489761_3472 [Tenacibaculum sp. MAR_2009_124]|uniref:hypothetical protein n=1 Tax=Tenacibaculum sp. MAR_2009_124 TaxID=1250059 RepID=UPI00089A3E94|nr:hypothetical protein [Tenacibaculum sp. MAR_2009_124]SEC67523.1 hypothetical protein SAMN04489761_3472 [Tenacibaculum sp. MAR_2009_124]